MKFQLHLDIKKLDPLINHHQGLFLIGSCFTENIGEKLKRNKFSVLENPNGILFNPVSVAESMIDCIENKKFTRDELFYFKEGWHSWKHHSRFSGLEAEEALQKINASTDKAHRFLKTAEVVMITLGSAWVYRLTSLALNAEEGRVAANNHKGPANWFHRKLMTPEEVLQVLDPLIHRLFLFNPKANIIFTVSPVRHIREGVIENNRSKAVLIQAVHHLAGKFNRIYYFPAYELVIDVLRDYRFYAEDLVHPNYQATQFVWEKFMEACLEPRTILLLEELHAIHLAFQHKPFNPTSEEHKKFLRLFYERTIQLENQHPYLDLEKEIDFFRT